MTGKDAAVSVEVGEICGGYAVIRFLVVAALLWPGASVAQSINENLIGTWSGGGTVHLKPTSKSQRTSCSATFDQHSNFWLRGAVSCKKGRRTDRVELRFTQPNRAGDLQMNIVGKNGKALVTFEGSISGSEITLFHPEVLTFSGEAYRPVLRIDAQGDGFRFSQIGVPTRSNTSQYMMSDLIFERLTN